jgi:hypothetical protein
LALALSGLNPFPSPNSVSIAYISTLHAFTHEISTVKKKRKGNKQAGITARDQFVCSLKSKLSHRTMICVLCGLEETTDHFFISCHSSRLVWRVVHFTFNIPPLINMTNLFGNWLNEIDKKIKEQNRVGVCALVWIILNCHNKVIFNRCANPNFLQVIHRTAFLIYLWSYLLPAEQRVPLDTECSRLMTVVRVIFNQVAGCTLGALTMPHRHYGNTLHTRFPVQSLYDAGIKRRSSYTLLYRKPYRKGRTVAMRHRTCSRVLDIIQLAPFFVG